MTAPSRALRGLARDRDPWDYATSEYGAAQVRVTARLPAGATRAHARARCGGRLHRDAGARAIHWSRSDFSRPGGPGPRPGSAGRGGRVPASEPPRGDAGRALRHDVCAEVLYLMRAPSWSVTGASGWRRRWPRAATARRPLEPPGPASRADRRHVHAILETAPSRPRRKPQHLPRTCSTAGGRMAAAAVGSGS